jgi:hypothetical protein
MTLHGRNQVAVIAGEQFRLLTGNVNNLVSIP